MYIYIYIIYIYIYNIYIYIYIIIKCLKNLPLQPDSSKGNLQVVYDHLKIPLG